MSALIHGKDRTNPKQILFEVGHRRARFNWVKVRLTNKNLQWMRVKCVIPNLQGQEVDEIKVYFKHITTKELEKPKQLVYAEPLGLLLAVLRNAKEAALITQSIDEHATWEINI